MLVQQVAVVADLMEGVYLVVCVVLILTAVKPINVIASVSQVGFSDKHHFESHLVVQHPIREFILTEITFLKSCVVMLTLEE